MEVCILAVTKARSGEFCIAGITEEGNWVRPIPENSLTRFWTTSQLTFNKNYGFLRAGDVIRFDGQKPQSLQHPNHTEDYLVSENHFELITRYSNDQLLNFLEGKDETEENFLRTVNAQKRSLCLVKVDAFQQQITQYPGESSKPKMTFTNNDFSVTNPKTTPGNYIVKDCKWSNLVLNNTIRDNLSFNKIYLAIGLATKWGVNQIEYPQVIGLHTEPEIQTPLTYPN
jgi:hypothetical protein